MSVMAQVGRLLELHHAAREKKPLPPARTKLLTRAKEALASGAITRAQYAEIARKLVAR